MITDKKELIFAEVGKNSNKYWCGELHDDGRVVSKFGRVGFALQECDYGVKGARFLEKKYNEKIKKGYTVLKTVADGVVETKNSNLKDAARNQIKLSDPTLQDLVDRLVKYNIHNITSNTTIKYDVQSGLFTTPLGLVTKEAIDEARLVLADISEVVKQDKQDSKPQLFNQYLRLIPQNIGMKFVIRNIFPDTDSVEKQLGILDSLEVSLNTARTPEKKQVIEEKLFDLEIKLMDANELKRITKWYEDSKRSMHGYGHYKIKRGYEVILNQNRASFKDIGNIQEVFHGTSCANSLSILKSGLKVSPPSTAAIAGKMFGNGVYGSQTSSKSLGYTFGRWGQGQGQIGHIYILDFAMGVPYYAKNSLSHVPNGYDSCWALPKNTGLHNDELIVYKNEHIKIKYLLEIE